MVNKIPSLDIWPEPDPFQDEPARYQKDHNWHELGSWGPKFSKWAYSFEDRVNNLIDGVAQPNELVDAHLSGSTGMKFKTITDRLNYMEDNAATKSDLKVSTTYANLHRLGQKYRTQGSVASNAQGFASLGNQIVVQYFQNHSPLDAQYGTLVKFDVTDGNEIMSNEIKGFHGNSMTFNSIDGMLYLCPAEDQSGANEQAQRTTIIQINPETLTVKNTIDLTGTTNLSGIHAIGFDNVDRVFIISNQKTLEFYDLTWKLLYTIELADLIGFEPDYMQGVQVHGDDLYWIGGRRSQIWAFKIDHQNKNLIFKTIYTFDDFQENIYPIGEIEGIGFDDENEKIYLVSHISVGNFGGLTEYFETNPNFKIVAQGGRTASIQNTNAYDVKFYAGHNSNYNPDGTKNNPFASLLEASVCMRTPYTPFNSLVLLDDFPDETLTLINISDAMGTFAGHKVKAVVVINSSNLYFSDITTIGFSRWHLNALYFYNSQVRINSFKSEGLENESKVTDAVYAERSNIFMNNNSAVQVKLENSTLMAPGYTTKVIKGNAMSQVLGFNDIGTITDIKNVVQLNVAGFNYYKYINAAITVNIDGSQITFSTKNTTGGIMHLVGYSELKGTLYICSFHLVKGDATNTTLTIYKASDMSKVSPKNYSIQVSLSDI